MSYSKLDANQVIKTVFDEATGSLKTVPASATSFAIELDAADGDSVETRSMAVDTTTLLNSVSAASSVNSSAVDVLKYTIMGVSMVWSGLDAVNGTLQLQGSIDGTTWFNEGSVETLSSASGSAKRKISDNEYKQVRVVYSAGSNTAGTISVKYVLKG